MASIPGLSWLVQVPNILAPLLFTGKSQSVCALFNRYLDTVIYVSSWFDTDIFDPTSEGHKTLAIVRNLHKHANKAVNAAHKDKNANHPHDGRVWVNQYDMAITQWAFIALEMLHPKVSGCLT